DLIRNGALTANASPSSAAGLPAGPVPEGGYSKPVPLVPAPSAERSQSTAQPPANPRWAEAERVEKEGRIRDAIDLDYQLGRDVSNSDHELSMRCFNQAAALQRRGVYAVETRLRPVAAGSPGVAFAAPQACCVPCGQNEYIFRGRLREAHRSVDYKPT